MSFWSSVLGGKVTRYQPWSGDYFASIEGDVTEQSTARPLQDYEGLDGFAVVGKREGKHHTLLTLRHPEEGLYVLKVAGPNSPREVARRLGEELSLLVGLSTSYHLAPFDVLHAPWIDGEYGTTFTYYSGDLAGRRGAGPLSVAEVAHYALQLAAELLDVHANGVLHLAVQPANVIISRCPRNTVLCRWRLLLAHFDLRGVRVGEETLPGLGPDEFSAPEQRRTGSPSIQTDVWGLGATLHYLCTGRPPAPPSTGAAPPVDLGSPYPGWLSRIVASCLETDPTRRPATAMSVIEALLEHVRVVSDLPGIDGAKKGAAGPDEARADVVIPDRFLLACANRLGKVPGVPVMQMKDLGWATRFKEANRLHKAGTASSLRRACVVLERALGNWEDPASLLGQFARQPNGPRFNPCEPPPRRIGNEIWGTAGLPVPIGALWGMLDLYCRSLVLLVEKSGQTSDVARMRTFCERWLKTGSFGTPSTKPIGEEGYPAADCLIHIAQALRYAGEAGRAREVIEAAVQDSPTNLLALLTAFLVARDRGDYEEGFKIGEVVASRALKAKDFFAYSKVFMLSADLAFRSKDYRRAKEMYSVLLKEAPSPEVENLACQVDCHLRSAGDASEVERALAVASRGGKLEQWFAAVEIAQFAGDRPSMKRAVDAIRAEPQFSLPTDRWYQDELARIEATASGQTNAPPPPGAKPATAAQDRSSANSAPVQVDLPQLIEAFERTPEEQLFDEAHYEPETRLFTEYAWATLQESPKKWVLAMNMAFLVNEDISDAMGQAVANEALWLLGSVLQRIGGEEIQASQPVEDQFTAAHDDKGLLEDTAGAIAEVASKVGVYCSRDHGGVLQTGFDFKFATGATYSEADSASMKAGKRGTLRSLVESESEFRSALSAARQSGYLLVDGVALAAERRRADRGKSVPSEDMPVERDQLWPRNAEGRLASAAPRGTYSATAVALLSRAAGRLLAQRRAERIKGPTSRPRGKTGQ